MSSRTARPEVTGSISKADITIKELSDFRSKSKWSDLVISKSQPTELSQEANITTIESKLGLQASDLASRSQTQTDVISKSCCTFNSGSLHLTSFGDASSKFDLYTIKSQSDVAPRSQQPDLAARNISKMSTRTLESDLERSTLSSDISTTSCKSDLLSRSQAADFTYRAKADSSRYVPRSRFRSFEPDLISRYQQRSQNPGTKTRSKPFVSDLTPEAHVVDITSKSELADRTADLMSGAQTADQRTRLTQVDQLPREMLTYTSTARESESTSRFQPSPQSLSPTRCKSLASNNLILGAQVDDLVSGTKEVDFAFISTPSDQYTAVPSRKLYRSQTLDLEFKSQKPALALNPSSYTTWKSDRSKVDASELESRSTTADQMTSLITHRCHKLFRSQTLHLSSKPQKPDLAKCQSLASNPASRTLASGVASKVQASEYESRSKAAYQTTRARLQASHNLFPSHNLKSRSFVSDQTCTIQGGVMTRSLADELPSAVMAGSNCSLGLPSTSDLANRCLLGREVMGKSGSTSHDVTLAADLHHPEADLTSASQSSDVSSGSATSDLPVPAALELIYPLADLTSEYDFSTGSVQLNTFSSSQSSDLSTRPQIDQLDVSFTSKTPMFLPVFQTKVEQPEPREVRTTLVKDDLQRVPDSVEQVLEAALVPESREAAAKPFTFEEEVPDVTTASEKEEESSGDYLGSQQIILLEPMQDALNVYEEAEDKIDDFPEVLEVEVESGDYRTVKVHHHPRQVIFVRVKQVTFVTAKMIKEEAGKMLGINADDLALFGLFRGKPDYPTKLFLDVEVLPDNINKFSMLRLSFDFSKEQDKLSLSDGAVQLLFWELKYQYERNKMGPAMYENWNRELSDALSDYKVNEWEIAAYADQNGTVTDSMSGFNSIGYQVRGMRSIFESCSLYSCDYYYRSEKCTTRDILVYVAPRPDARMEVTVALNINQVVFLNNSGKVLYSLPWDVIRSIQMILQPEPILMFEVLVCEDFYCVYKYIIIRTELAEYLFSIGDYILETHANTPLKPAPPRKKPQENLKTKWQTVKPWKKRIPHQPKKDRNPPPLPFISVQAVDPFGYTNAKSVLVHSAVDTSTPPQHGSSSQLQFDLPPAPRKQIVIYPLYQTRQGPLPIPRPLTAPSPQRCPLFYQPLHNPVPPYMHGVPFRHTIPASSELDSQRIPDVPFRHSFPTGLQSRPQTAPSLSALAKPMTKAMSSSSAKPRTTSPKTTSHLPKAKTTTTPSKAKQLLLTGSEEKSQMEATVSFASTKPQVVTNCIQTVHATSVKKRRPLAVKTTTETHSISDKGHREIVIPCPTTSGHLQQNTYGLDPYYKEPAGCVITSSRPRKVVVYVPHGRVPLQPPNQGLVDHDAPYMKTVPDSATSSSDPSQADEFTSMKEPSQIDYFTSAKCKLPLSSLPTGHQTSIQDSLSTSEVPLLSIPTGYQNSTQSSDLSTLQKQRLPLIITPIGHQATSLTAPDLSGSSVRHIEEPFHTLETLIRKPPDSRDFVRNPTAIHSTESFPTTLSSSTNFEASDRDFVEHANMTDNFALSQPPPQVIDETILELDKPDPSYCARHKKPQPPSSTVPPCDNTPLRPPGYAGYIYVEPTSPYKRPEPIDVNEKPGSDLVNGHIYLYKGMPLIHAIHTPTEDVHDYSVGLGERYVCFNARYSGAVAWEDRHISGQKIDHATRRWSLWKSLL